MDFLAELNLLSTGVSAWGDIMAGSAERKAYDMNASMVEFAGEQTQEDITKQEKELTSTQRAMFAKAGVTQSGSPLEVANAVAYMANQGGANFKAEKK